MNWDDLYDNRWMGHTEHSGAYDTRQKANLPTKLLPKNTKISRILVCRMKGGVWETVTADQLVGHSFYQVIIQETSE